MLWMLSVTDLVSAQMTNRTPLVTQQEYVPALVRAQTVLVKVTARTLDGPADPEALTAIVGRRFEEIGYSVVTSYGHPHDVAVDVHCQEQPSSLGTARDSDPPESPNSNRFSAGPPCVATYAHRGVTMSWQRVDRVVYTLGVEAARKVAAETSGADPGRRFDRYLKTYEYPLLLTAEWGQAERLRRLLEHPEVDPERKKMIILLLGEIRAEEALPCLVEALEQEALAKDAAEALGNFGASVKAPLVKLLRTSDRPDVQAAAAKSLGRVGATTGEWVLTTLFIDMLERPDLDIAVQIELVWALGKNPDRRALPILDNMYDRVWSVRSDDPQLQELRAAIDWSHRGARLGGHTDEY